MRSAIIAVVGALLVACQDPDVSRKVGARCDDASECDERCLPSTDGYPGGFCTVTCQARGECTGNTTCADREGGVCLFQCAESVDCDYLGEGWHCGSVDLRGGGIKVKVCLGS